MEFEWDDAKREKVLRERGLDLLALAKERFDGRPTLTNPSPRSDEERFISIGIVRDRIFALVWTRRGERMRLITVRRARDEEARQYRACHDGRN